MLLDLDIQDKDLTVEDSSTEQQPAQPVQYESAQIQPIQVVEQNGFESAKKEAFTQIVGDKEEPMSTEDAQKWRDLGYTSATEDVVSTGNYSPDYSDIPSSDAEFLTALGKVESGNNYYAKPNSSGYEGKYQFRFRKGDDGTRYLQKLGITRDQWRRSPELQEKMMQTVLKDYDKQLRSRHIPVNNYTRWLRHNQGLGGTSAILRGKLTPTIRRNIRNQGVSGKTDKELIANYHKKFAHRFKSRKLLTTKKEKKEG